MEGFILNRLDTVKHISVLNYNENCVSINVAPNKSMILEAASGEIPTLTPLTLDEIRYANNSNAFKTGVLEFPEELEDEIYNELRIDKDKVLKLKDIREILCHPTKEGLIKILSLNSLSDFDRVRGQFYKLKADGYKLTLDIADIIQRRTKELFNNQVKTNIIIDDADVADPSNKRVSELEKELADMKALMASFMSQQQNTEKVNKTDEKESEKKKPGRPKSTPEK